MNRRLTMSRRAVCLAVLVAPAGCGLLIDDIHVVPSEDSGAPDAAVDAVDDVAASDASGDADGSVSETVSPLFVFTRYLADAGGTRAYGYSPAMVDLAHPDAGIRPIACPSYGSFAYFDATPHAGGCPASAVNGPYLNGMLVMRGYYPPAATPPPGGARFVYSDVVPGGADAGDAGAVTDYPLYVIDESSDCASHKATRIDYEGPFVPGAQHVLPRFSPDGTRVAYLDIVPKQGCPSTSVQRLITVAVDGGQPHELRTADQVKSATNDAGSMWLTPPAWIDDTHVAWVEVDQAFCTSCQGKIRIMQAEDTLPPTVSQVLGCPRQSNDGGEQAFYGIEQVEFFSQGPVSTVALVGNVGPWVTFGQGSSDVYSSQLGLGCSAVFDLTPGSQPGSVSRDLAVSPDGSLSVFASNRPAPLQPSDGGAADADGGIEAGDGGDAGGQEALGAGSPMHLWIMRSAGDPAQPCSGVDPMADDVGPQWIRGGTQLVWTHLPHGGGGTGSIMMADVVAGTCTNVHPLLADPQGAPEAGLSPTYITGSNASVMCSSAAPGHSDGARGAAALAIAALASATRRRSRHRRGAG